MESMSENEVFLCWKVLMEFFLDMVDDAEDELLLDENIDESLCLKPLFLLSICLCFNSALTWLVLKLLVERTCPPKIFLLVCAFTMAWLKVSDEELSAVKALIMSKQSSSLSTEPVELANEMLVLAFSL